MDLDLFTTYGIVPFKYFDKRDDVNLEQINFPFLDGDVSRSPSYGVFTYILREYALM